MYRFVPRSGLLPRILSPADSELSIRPPQGAQGSPVVIGKKDESRKEDTSP